MGRNSPFAAGLLARYGADILRPETGLFLAFLSDRFGSGRNVAVHEGKIGQERTSNSHWEYRHPMGKGQRLKDVLLRGVGHREGEGPSQREEDVLVLPLGRAIRVAVDRDAVVT